MSIEWPPDEPVWIDVRSMLEAGGARFGDGGDYVVCDPPPTYSLAVVGRPGAELMAQALAIAAARVEVLAHDANLEHVRGLVPERVAEAVQMYAHPGQYPPVPVQPPVRRLTVDDPLSHVPAHLRAELERARMSKPVWSAFEGGHAVCFAYAHRETRTLADISIDTLEGYRRKGYAFAASAHLIHDLADRGLRPTWGAYESNDASQRLAARLGFVPAGRLWGLRVDQNLMVR